MCHIIFTKRIMQFLSFAVLLILLYCLAIFIGGSISDEMHRKRQVSYTRMNSIVKYLDSLDKTGFPESVYDLKKIFPIKDPFTGKPYIFIIDKHRGDWFLVGSGPSGDSTFDRITYSYVPYDPTNGTLSVGDIVYSKNISPSKYLFYGERSKYSRNGIWKKSFLGYERQSER
jgi:hypothetical protein